MECVNPNWRMLSCTGVRLWEVRLVRLCYCRALCSVDCFHILDHASTTLRLKIKEAFHIQREQPSLNQQLHRVNLKLSF